MDWKLDETRHTGRPGDSQGRSPAEMACYDFRPGQPADGNPARLCRYD